MKEFYGREIISHHELRKNESTYFPIGGHDFMQVLFEESCLLTVLVGINIRLSSGKYMAASNPFDLCSVRENHAYEAKLHPYGPSFWITFLAIGRSSYGPEIVNFQIQLPTQIERL